MFSQAIMSAIGILQIMHMLWDMLQPRQSEMLHYLHRFLKQLC